MYQKNTQKPISSSAKREQNNDEFVFLFIFLFFFFIKNIDI